MSRFRWSPTEALLLRLTAALLVLVVTVAPFRSATIAWIDYALIFAGASLLIAAGQYYRSSCRSEAIGSSLIGTGLLLTFPALLVVLNYLMLPISRPPVDAALAALDAKLGYDWRAVMAWGAENPSWSAFLKVCYSSVTVQLAVLVLVLGLSGRRRALDSLLLTMALTSVATLAIWTLFPTHGVGAVLSVSVETERAAAPVVTMAYAAELVRSGAAGAGLIAPDQVMGLISMPSYHTVMALLAMAGAWHVPWLRWPALMLNAFILPATLLHGGHHFVDVPAGVLLFVCGHYLSEAYLDRVPELAPRADRSAVA